MAKNGSDISQKKSLETPQKSPIAEREEKTLDFWNKDDIFKKSLEQDSPKGEFVFYDGPPFATGLPHYGHILAGTMKDVIPRYKTMRGYHVPRVWGWDTHGLPIENIIEKELGLKSKKDIEEFGIEKFNEAARAAVLRYDADWKKIIPRTGRWVDMEHAYLPMDPSYSESIWWSFKTLYDKGLIYQGFKSMHICPRCETTLSNFEVNLGYKDITDISVYVKLELTDEPGTFIVAWTTTPWTLPGNVALAVNPDIQYIQIEVKGEKVILAKDRLVVIKDEYKVEKEFTGKELLGKKYKPLFPYYDGAFKVVGADFVTTTDGTGIVHIAPGYGEDDYQLSLKEKLPFVQHVGIDGKFKKEVTDFAGLSVKPKDDHQKTDIEIIKYLAGKGTLFAKEKIIHSYPHCWRCDTPLLNYAASSWFVKVTDIKEKLVSENKKVLWVPEEMGEGRFGKWLEGAKDWAISRSRFWGAPLPVWECKECKKREVIGSVSDIAKKTKRNEYILIRHGGAESNAQNVLSGDPKAPNNLTAEGKKQVMAAAKKLKDAKIDHVFSSDFVRTKETTDILVKELELKNVEYDKRLREYNFGDLDGKTIDEWHAYWKQRGWGDIEEKVPGGESPADIRDRVQDFIESVDKKYEGKTILIVSHEDPLRYLQSIVQGDDIAKVSKEKWKTYRLKNAEVKELDYGHLPRNKRGELDLHRPYIDEVTFACESCRGVMHRVPEVFDTWYESGSMPYGKIHYPFENKKLIDEKKEFPADFIAEGQDQTRGWFYSLLILSTSLFGQSPYKNVIVNGIVLAEDGQKMSKRLQNYPELMDVVNKYGADALRFYLVSSPVVRAQDLAFSEKGVDEVLKKVIMRLQNVYTFFETYRHEEKKFDLASVKNVLDLWILARLNELIKETTTGLDKYELDKASRPLFDFVDDLSTWYLRRSRDRFKGEDEQDKQSALHTTHYVLFEMAKIMAPFMPFLAEELYQNVKRKEDKDSVHLETWPEFSEPDTKILESMKEVRSTVSLALEARAKAGIKVRQPLHKLTIQTEVKNKELLEVIKDEVNVKEIEVGSSLELDTNISEDLRQEGQARELIRGIQELRKNAKLSPQDKIEINISTSEVGKKLVEKFTPDISKTAQITKISFKESGGEKIVVDDTEFGIEIKK